MLISLWQHRRRSSGSKRRRSFLLLSPAKRNSTRRRTTRRSPISRCYTRIRSLRFRNSRWTISEILPSSWWSSSTRFGTRGCEYRSWGYRCEEHDSVNFEAEGGCCDVGESCRIIFSCDPYTDRTWVAYEQYLRHLFWWVMTMQWQYNTFADRLWI